MTNEEAKAYFMDSNKRIVSVAKDENRYNYETQQIEDGFMRRDFEAKELAIKALEQHPSEDCISRQAVDALVDELARAISDERCCISRGRDTATIIRDILHLPPVTSQQKTGHWIRVDKDKCKCDQCEVISFIAIYPNGDKNYCPNCGAKNMVEPQEGEEE